MLKTLVVPNPYACLGEVYCQQEFWRLSKVAGFPWIDNIRPAFADGPGVFDHQIGDGFSGAANQRGPSGEFDLRSGAPSAIWAVAQNLPRAYTKA